MSTLKAHNIEPATGTDVALGAAGDSITVSGDSLKLNTFKDAGANTLFTSDGSGTLSNVNSGLKGGGPILIQTQTASGASSVSFTSGIDSTYDKYMFVWMNLNPATDNVDFTFQVNAAGASGFNETITSTFFAAYHSEADNAAAMGYFTSYDQGQGTSYQVLCYDTGSGADEGTSGILYLFSPSSTTYVKHFYARVSNYHQGNYAQDAYAAGYINTTLAIDEISFKMESGNFDGKIKMYGIA